jgi:hypothetical protein
MAKLFYKVSPDEYKEMMRQVREKYNLHEDIDEDKTILTADDEESIIKVSASFDPSSDDVAKVKVILVDAALRDYFNSVFGEPYKERR